MEIKELYKKFLKAKGVSSKYRNLAAGKKIDVSKKGLWDKKKKQVIVPSNRITMKGPNGEQDFFKKPVVATGLQSGQQVMMQPGGEYYFPNDKAVHEVRMQSGGSVFSRKKIGVPDEDPQLVRPPDLPTLPSDAGTVNKWLYQKADKRQKKLQSQFDAERSLEKEAKYTGSGDYADLLTAEFYGPNKTFDDLNDEDRSKISNIIQNRQKNLDTISLVSADLTNQNIKAGYDPNYHRMYLPPVPTERGVHSHEFSHVGDQAGFQDGVNPGVGTYFTEQLNKSVYPKESPDYLNQPSSLKKNKTIGQNVEEGYSEAEYLQDPSEVKARLRALRDSSIQQGYKLLEPGYDINKYKEGFNQEEKKQYEQLKKSGLSDDKINQMMYLFAKNNQAQPTVVQKGGTILSMGDYDVTTAPKKGNYLLPDINRPSYKDESGNRRSEYKMGFNVDGKETLIPSVVGGKQLTEDEAVARYRKTGLHMGQYNTPEEADYAARSRTAKYNMLEDPIRFQANQFQDGGSVQTDITTSIRKKPSPSQDAFDAMLAKYEASKEAPEEDASVPEDMGFQSGGELPVVIDSLFSNFRSGIGKKYAQNGMAVPGVNGTVVANTNAPIIEKVKKSMQEGGKKKESSRSLVDLIPQITPGVNDVMDFTDIIQGAASGNRTQMNQGIIGIASPGLAGGAAPTFLDFVTEKTLGKDVADSNQSKREGIVNMSSSDLQKLYAKYGPGGYDKWKAAGFPKLQMGGMSIPGVNGSVVSSTNVPSLEDRKNLKQGGKVSNDKEMVDGVASILRRVKDKDNRQDLAKQLSKQFDREKVRYNLSDFLNKSKVKK